MRNIKKLLSMLLCLCACAKKKDEAQNTAPEVSYDAPAANVNPTFVNWGNRRGVDNSADPWYPDGKYGEDYIYFAYGESSAGIVLSHVKDGVEVANAACGLTDDLHLVTESGSMDVDIIFPSDFHAYDIKTETWYIRANPDFMRGLFAGKSFTEKSSSNDGS